MGGGAQTGKLSNLHPGARDPSGGFGGPGGFVMVGKTFGGTPTSCRSGRQGTETECNAHVVFYARTRRRDRAGRSVALAPLSRRHRQRFARVKGNRPDKVAAEADSVQRLRALLRE